MPVKAGRQGDKYIVKEVGSGKVMKGARPTTKAKATKQAQAVNISLKSKGKL